MRSFMATVPLFVPGMILWGLLAIMVSPVVARSLRTSRAHAALVLVALGLTLMATMTPTTAGLSGAATSLGACNMARLSPASAAMLFSINDASLNVLLFVPLGLALGALPWSPRTAAVVLSAFLLPLAIELFQLGFPSLGRSCQSADVIDNTLGLVIGLAAGAGARWLVGRARGVAWGQTRS